MDKLIQLKAQAFDLTKALEMIHRQIDIEELKRHMQNSKAKDEIPCEQKPS